MGGRCPSARRKCRQWWRTSNFCRPACRRVSCCPAWARARCRSLIARPIRNAGRRATLMPARCVMPRMALVFGYMVPPLWGGDSFNDGAGMARLITAANLLHFNMPHGVDYLNPQLSPEQAWDIAAYVISQPRPHKAGLDKDFPDLLENPVHAPYGPYADGFGEQQHKYGPFAPIRAAIAKLKAEKAGGPTPDRKSTRLNSSHQIISYAVFCLK